jgi:hypothetical protein
MKDKKMVLRFSRMAVKFFVPADIFQQESSPTCFAKFWNLLRFTSIENTHIFLWPHPILESCHYVFFKSLARRYRKRSLLRSRHFLNGFGDFAVPQYFILFSHFHFLTPHRRGEVAWVYFCEPSWHAGYTSRSE